MKENGLDRVGLGRDDRRHLVSARAGVHTIIYGLTGSGKGSIEANWLQATMPGVYAGAVQNWGIDLKAGLEFAMYGPGVFARTAWTLDDAIGLLHELDGLVRERAEQARGVTRRLDPSPEHPRINLFIDEAAELCTAPTRELRKQTDEAVGVLDSILRLSRALGVVVVAATQDPRQASMPLRPRFPQRIALRLNDESEAEMALGAEALKLGARPQRISVDRPGEAYFFDTERRLVQHFRAPYITDDQLRHMGGGVGA